MRRFVPCRTVVLVGLMGAGKTKIGRRLAMRLGLPFFDSDQEIEAAAGETIEEIFANRGERVFREGERRVIAPLAGEAGACAGDRRRRLYGPATRAVIRRRGVSLWLRADLDVLVQRVSRRSDRPLLNAGDPRAILAELIERRHPIYGEADVTIDSGDGIAGSDGEPGDCGARRLPARADAARNGVREMTTVSERCIRAAARRARRSRLRHRRRAGADRDGRARDPAADAPPSRRRRHRRECRRRIGWRRCATASPRPASRSTRWYCRPARRPRISAISAGSPTTSWLAASSADRCWWRSAAASSAT